MQIQENNKEEFHFTYSAKEQEELKKIRQKYQPQEEDKMETLRRMDERVTKKATMISIMYGVVGALIMGIGMSLTMTEIGTGLGLDETVTLILGIVIGLTGIVCISVAYPVYTRTLKKERDKIAPEILRMTDELMK